ncbi:hypothetical protein ACLVWU_04540 [Bdellovibrio sp. HCB290]|uniref:hypothetical protein n=1 Tax=Bdellovibrio sp. HCB290 TaxID=3394356 RepID=UPI0039B55969
MNQILKSHKVLLLTTLIVVVAALAYILVTPKTFVANSRAAIFRMKIENPDNGSDESRNRWIWIRDGLNIGSATVTDEQIKKFLAANEEAKAATAQFSSESSKVKFLKSLVNVQFTGADENNYVIEVKSSNPVLALQLNQNVFENLKFLAVQKDNEDFQALAEKITQEAAAFPANSQERSFYQNKLVKLKFEHVISQSQKERVFSVIAEPSVSDKAIWPKPAAILVVAILAGLVLGFLFEYLMFAFKRD